MMASPVKRCGNTDNPLNIDVGVPQKCLSCQPIASR
jgi:hypothetical protein